MGKTGEDENGLQLTPAHLFSNLQQVSLYMYQNVIYTAGKSFLVVM